MATIQEMVASKDKNGLVDAFLGIAYTAAKGDDDKLSTAYMSLIDCVGTFIEEGVNPCGLPKYLKTCVHRAISNEQRDARRHLTRICKVPSQEAQIHHDYADFEAWCDFQDLIETNRERQFVELALQGCNGPEIARRTGFSLSLVTKVLNKLLAKWEERDAQT